MSPARPHGPRECREIFERLSEYLDGELPPDPCAVLEAHFEDCAPCRAFLESLRATVRLIERDEHPPLPDDLRRRIREAYRALEREGPGD